MQNAVIVKGRLIGPRSVELNETIDTVATDVEVLIRSVPEPQVDQAETLSLFLRNLPVGTRSKEDIDAQIHAERASWGDP